MVTKEQITKIVNFITPEREGIIVLGRGHFRCILHYYIISLKIFLYTPGNRSAKMRIK